MCHVLVIEDEPLIAEYVAALAEMAGATSSTIVDTVKRRDQRCPESDARSDPVRRKPSCTGNADRTLSPAFARRWVKSP